MRKTFSALLTAALTLAQPGWADDMSGQVLSLVNAVRARAGCPALVINRKLVASASGHAKAMAEQNFFSHKGKDGSAFTRRFREQGYAYGYAAENIAMGYSTAQKVMDIWMSSPGHRANILDCALTETGISMFYQADDKPLPGMNFTAKYYWVEDFARRK